jgi:hypothetical protein
MAEILKVTNIKTGKVWVGENCPHAWADLCLNMMKKHEDIKLIYCDIEGIVEFHGDWIMLDECGSYAYIPEEYKVERVKV